MRDTWHLQRRTFMGLSGNADSQVLCIFQHVQPLFVLIGKLTAGIACHDLRPVHAQLQQLCCQFNQQQLRLPVAQLLSHSGA